MPISIDQDLVRRIKIFVTDVDGTLTDGGMYYSADGEELKKFNTRDAFGMNLLRKAGIKIAIVTSEDSEIVRARAKKLKMEDVFLGVQDKVPCVENLLSKYALKFENLAYIGDDLNDLAVIEKAGFSACPADACWQIKRRVDYVCQEKGGEGAVREFCDMLMSHI